MTTGSTPPRRDLPTGTITFLRTDVEGSMALAQRLGREWDAVNDRHHARIREAVEAHGGAMVRTEGDAAFAVFPEASAAVMAAVAAQRALAAESWPPDAAVRVRMGLHTGEAHLAGDDYGGFDVNRAARVSAVGHGGQIVVSGTTHALIASSLPSGIGLRDLGRHVLKDVAAPESLFQVEVLGLPNVFPRLRSIGAADGNLPARLTSFVGRGADLAELEPLSHGARLITLTGPGGIGKTSLAVEFARSIAGSLPDGAWFVPLDAIEESDQVGSMIARTLGLFDGIERSAADALPAFLANRSMILVLDNFEQVLDAAGVVSSLLHASPGSRFIVTSRAPLRIAGEQEYPVRPLSMVDSSVGVAGRDDASTRLFIDRARAVLPGWDPGLDASVVAEICASVDGLPLGIELAAARMSLLPIRAIRDRLATHLPLPGAGPRDAPTRQRTLEATIEWSYDLLSPEDQRTLLDLGVFEGTFDAEQVGSVVAPAGQVGDGQDVVDRVISLAERSLISRDLAPIGDDASLEATGIRFGMLKTVQAFAASRLIADGREAETRDRHEAAYLALAEAAASHLNSGDQPPWLDRLARDDANLRAALRWSIAAGHVESAQRLLGALWRYWLLTGSLGEGAEHVEAVLSMPDANRPTKALAGALAAAGGIAYWRADSAGAKGRYEQQLEIAQRIGDEAGVADAWYNLASARFVIGDPTAAHEAALEARRGYASLGDAIWVNRVEWGMTNLAMELRPLSEQIPEMLRILYKAEALGDAPYAAMTSGSLAWAAFMSGDLPSAGRWTLKAMLGYYAIRDVASSTVSLPIGAVMALEWGRPREAGILLGAFEALALRYGVRPPLGLDVLIKSADPLERVRRILPPDGLEDALAIGRRMTLGETMDLMVSLAEVAVPGG